jgi:hypothetical protein
MAGIEQAHQKSCARLPSVQAARARELERVADTDADLRTPLILIGEVWVVCAIAVLVLLALALLAYRLAT